MLLRCWLLKGDSPSASQRLAPSLHILSKIYDTTGVDFCVRQN